MSLSSPSIHPRCRHVCLTLPMVLEVHPNIDFYFMCYVSSGLFTMCIGSSLSSPQNPLWAPCVLTVTFSDSHLPQGRSERGAEESGGLSFGDTPPRRSEEWEDPREIKARKAGGRPGKGRKWKLGETHAKKKMTALSDDAEVCREVKAGRCLE